MGLLAGEVDFTVWGIVLISGHYYVIVCSVLRRLNSTLWSLKMFCDKFKPVLRFEVLNQTEISGTDHCFRIRRQFLQALDEVRKNITVRMYQNMDINVS